MLRLGIVSYSINVGAQSLLDNIIRCLSISYKILMSRKILEPNIAYQVGRLSQTPEKCSHTYRKPSNRYDR